MNKIEFISQLNNLIDTFEDSAEAVEFNHSDAISFKRKVARDFYRIVKYPTGPTAWKWKALLVEGEDFTNPDVQERFIDAVEDFQD